MPQKVLNDSNAALVEQLWCNRIITNSLVKSAFLKVDRGQYIDCHYRYEDTPQIIGHQATISAPHMHAKAAELLLPHLLPRRSNLQSSSDDGDLSRKDVRARRILDIGSGSGYLVHVFAEIAGETAVVVGIDHQESLTKLGETNMRKSSRGAKLIASGRARFHLGDGRKGWSEPDCPQENGWDVIHVGATAVELPDELLQQLRAPGRMFIPLVEEQGNRFSDTYIWTVDKDSSGNVTMEKHSQASFVSLM